MIMYAVAQPETQALNLDEWTRYRSIVDNLTRRGGAGRAAIRNPAAT
jgi:hypothetical protein